MASLDVHCMSFEPFGFKKVLFFDAVRVNVHVGSTPLLVLLPESPSDNAVKADNLRVACQLIDEGIVDLVAVEERFGGDVNAKVLGELMNQHGAPSLEAYSRDLHLHHGGDDAIIQGIRKSKAEVSFARQLLYLRPRIRVVGVDDPELAARADEQAAAIALEFEEEPDTDKRERKQMAKFRDLQVNRDREAAFLENIAAARREFGSTKGVILSAGGYHHQHLIDGCAQSDSYLLIYPPSYRITDIPR